MNKCVHTEHCCAIHGCKYGDLSCPVKVGEKEQSHPCWDCYDDDMKSLEQVLRFARIMKISYDVAHIVHKYSLLNQEEKEMFLKEIAGPKEQESNHEENK